jgi:hypothetical protein
MNFWRFEGMDERDFEWFENKYPGWYANYGAFWEAYREATDPSSDFIPAQLMNLAPPFCWTCQLLCVLEHERRHRVVDDHTRFYCCKECQWLDESNPGRYTGDRNFLDRYHGWELSRAVQDLGFVRADGETLIAQPHLRDDRLWTLSDLRRFDVEVVSPNVRVARELGLPSGNHAHPALV